LKYLADSPGAGYQPAAQALPQLAMVVLRQVTSVPGPSQPGPWPFVQGSRLAEVSASQMLAISGRRKQKRVPTHRQQGLSLFGSVSCRTFEARAFAPLTVELFAAGHFDLTPSVVVRPVPCVAAREAPGASRVERTRTEAMNPVGS
jgi:hypothetical protein